MPWVDKNIWTPASGGAGYANGKYQDGVQGNRINVYPYKAYFGKGFSTVPTLPNGARQPDPNVPSSALVTLFLAASFPSATNQAWESLVENTRQGAASVGVSLAEWEQSLDMVTRRSAQLYRGYRQLRKGDFRGFLKEFDTKPKRKHRNRVSNKVNEASSLWLEYSFGWKPLTVDIYNAVNAIGQPVPGGPVRGSGSWEWVHSVVPSNGSGLKFRTKAWCNQGADIYITNPNLYMLQQLGVANPGLIAWELVPFSFLADWVFDISSCLGAFTDLLGCSVQNGYTNHRVKNVHTEFIWTWGFTTPAQVYSCAGKVSCMKRSAGLTKPVPNLDIRANIGQSLNRAANAASLLGQILTK